MPGSIKNSGVWRSATGLYVKVSGTWRTVTSAYVKVGGQWKQWFASKIQDAFNRSSTAAGLGTADSGQAWNATSGNWRINGSNQAQSDDSASTYPVASANLGNTDVKVQADVSGGVGPAFWVSAAGSWWAAVPRYSTYTTSSSSTVCDQGLATCSGSGCNPSGSCCSGISTSTSTNCDSGFAQSTSNPPAGNCCSGVWQSGGGSSCSGGYVSNTSNPPAGNCCSGVSQSTSPGACNQSQVSGSSNPPAGNCCSGVSSSGGGTSTVCDQGLVTGGTEIIPLCCSSVASSTVQLCNTGQITASSCSLLSGCCGSCFQSSSGSSGSSRYEVSDGGSCWYPGITDTYQQVGCSNCVGLGPCGTGGFVCCLYTTGGTGPQYSCYTGTTPYTAYSCYTSTRTVTNPTTYSCYTGYSASTTTYSCYTSYVTNPTYYNCYTSYSSSTTRSCYTSTRTVTTNTTNYKTELVILSSVSGTVVSAAATTISDNTSGYTSVGSVYVQTGGNAISAYAYSAANLGGSQLGSTLNHTASNPTKGTSVGILKAPSTGSQGSTADNFLATI